MSVIMSLMKRLVPAPMFLAYHRVLASIAEIFYRYPSQSMVVIGVTGTNGKSSTVNFIAQLLAALHQTVGFTSTAGFSIAGKEITNAMKMTMPGRFVLQKLLRKMVNDGCGYAIIETSSQGLVQYRHIGINYDVAVFTNLTPEHIEAHGGFEKYKRAKSLLFTHLVKRSRKTVNGSVIPKINIVNADDKYGDFFASFPADKHYSFGFVGQMSAEHFVGAVRDPSPSGVLFSVNGREVSLPLLANFEHKNALAAVATVTALGFPLENVLRAATKLTAVPGRFERIDCGQPFTVIVDYAYEPYALLALYDSLPNISGRILGLHGSAGGGRDVARRAEIGRIAALHDDVVIVTNEDPYDEDPRGIMDAVADGARRHGKIDGETLFVIDDRQQAIDLIMTQACAGDVVLITGKGSEPVMAVRGGTIPWDDRRAVRQALAKCGYQI